MEGRLVKKNMINQNNKVQNSYLVRQHEIFIYFQCLYQQKEKVFNPLGSRKGLYQRTSTSTAPVIINKTNLGKLLFKEVQQMEKASKFEQCFFTFNSSLKKLTVLFKNINF